MNIGKQRDTLRQAIARYRNNPWVSLATREALARLDAESCTRADIDAITGVPEVTDFHCDECGRQVAERIEFSRPEEGDEIYDEGPRFNVCADCLRAALAMLTTEDK